MTTEQPNLSGTARTFLHLLNTTAPHLAQHVTVVSPSREQPWIEEAGSIVMKIPAPKVSKLEYLYLETRKQSIVILVGTLLSFHFDWTAKDEFKESVLRALHFLIDILEERKVILERKAGIGFVRWTRVKCVDLAQLAGQKGTFAAYSWMGTYDTVRTRLL